MNMNLLFVPYEIALKLKELGFDEECYGVFVQDKGNILVPISNIYYTGCALLKHIKAPLWQQVFDYLRKNGIYVEIRFADKALTQYEFFVFKTYEEQVNQIIRNIKLGDSRLTYKSYEEAREQAVLKALELLSLLK